MDGFVRGDLWCSRWVSLLLRLTSLTTDVSGKTDPSLIELQLEMDLLEFLSVCAIVTFVECCAVCLNRRSLHKKVKLCCPMLETINYDFSVSLQPSCNEYRHSDCIDDEDHQVPFMLPRPEAMHNETFFFFTRSP